jgi:glucose-1-phosphate thymidylyltransferase
MNVVVFEDDFVNELFPITTGRLAYNIGCASYRLVEWLQKLSAPLFGQVRPHMRTIQEMDFPEIRDPHTLTKGDRLYVNARSVPSASVFKTLQVIASRQQYGVIRTGDTIAAAYLPENHPGILTESNGVINAATITPDRLSDLPVLGSQIDLFEYPHDVVRFNMSCFAENIQHRLAQGGFEEIAEQTFLGQGATLGEYCVLDTSKGPVVIDKGATIGPYCYFCGPVYVGPNSRVIEHAALKDAVSLGHTTKIGGEIEASVIEPYTNKQHHGFLGHSYLGSWINLGAGTCNSDLKNTYGEVKMEYRGSKVSSKMQFLGCIIGDYSKSAINSGIFTGKTIGTSSMLYGFITTNVPSFVNYARTFGQITELPPSITVATQKRMFLRRNVQQRPCDIQLIHDMYSLTADERQLAGEPLSL